jgi:hypothetical protein
VEPNVPAKWSKGQLLNLKRYTTSLGVISYRATAMGDEDDPKTGYGAPFVEFDNSYDAQTFVSNWYAPAPSVGGVYG